MSRWIWLKNREQRLTSGPLADVLKDLHYCRERERLSKLEVHKKTWRSRAREAENAIVKRFGEDALKK